MLTLVEKILFILLVATSIVLSYITFGRMIRTILRGQGKITININFSFLRDLVFAFFNQGKMIERRTLTSIFHYMVAWGFLFYLIINLADILEGYINGFQFLGDGTVGGAYRFLADIFTTAALVGVIYLMLRRFIARDKALTARDNVMLLSKARTGIPRDSLIVGVFIFVHLSFRWLGQSMLIAIEGGDAWQPFASTVATLWSGASTETLEVAWHICWWVALGALFAFLPYFPYTKHAHLFMGPFNIASRAKRRALGALEPLDFEDESIEQFGAARLSDLSQTQVLDAFACIMCNRCQEACPAYATGKELSPAAIEINKRYHIKSKMNGLASGEEDSDLLLDFAISESAVWACTTCGACVEVCPVGNEPMFDILNIRQNQVLMESKFPHELVSAFNGMERMANPWGMTSDRLEWTKALDFKVPTVAENPDFDVLYWVGCAGAFDPNAQEIARATATVLQAAGVNFAVLGNDETCTGDSARRAGNDYLFFEMAMMNIEKLQEVGAEERKILATCPHCFHTLANEYPDFGGVFKVVHHTQFIAELIGNGTLTLRNGRVLEKVTFHDPCYLGRHNGVYDPPREALQKAGAILIEMDRSRQDSFCCGAGGAQMWKEEEHGTQNVNINRFEEAKRTGATTVATGCPFCAIMMADANRQDDLSMEVRDVAQVVAEQLA